MIIYSPWLFEVGASYLSDIETAFREGGIVHESFRRIPGHIHTDLLSRIENPPGRCRLLSISFFSSTEAMLHARQSTEMRAFAHWLHERTKQCIHLGTFSLQPKSEGEIPSIMTALTLSTDFALKETPK